MADRVYHWKHGWVPLDHPAAMSKAKGNPAGAARALHAVPQADLRRSPHILAARTSSARVSLHDTKSGHTVGVDSASIDALHSQGHTITGVGNGHIVTRNADGHAATYSTGGNALTLRRTITGTDQYGRPITFTGHVSAESQATQHGRPGVVYSMHNGSDSSGLDATARTAVFVPHLNPQAAAAYGGHVSPSERRTENQGKYKVGDEAAVKGSGGTYRIGKVVDIADDGRLVIHVPGEGKVTRAATDIPATIPAATRAAEQRRAAGNWSKTPTDRLKRAVTSPAFSQAQRLAMAAELARRGVKVG